MQVTWLYVKIVLLNLFFSDYFAMYDPIYWERNKIQVKAFIDLDINHNEYSHDSSWNLKPFFFLFVSGVFDSIVTVYREEGILGFFA